MRGDAMAEKTTSEKTTSEKTTAAPRPAPLPAELDTGAEDSTIRPFHIDVPEDELVDLRRRIEATRWPEKETVEDQSQGPRLATMQALARYWATEYVCRTSSPRSMGWTFTSFTSARSMKMRCRSSSCTDGPARSSSS